MTSTTRLQQRYFEDVQLGDEFAEEHAPDTDAVRTFLNLVRNEGDEVRNRFTDPEVARRDGLERPIVPGSMSLSLVTRLVTDWMGPVGTLQSIGVSFRRPVLHDDRMRAVGLVTDVQPEGEGGRVKLDIYLENDRGERPVQGTATVDLPARPAQR